jgi:ADP-ribose pyrophosphatase
VRRRTSGGWQILSSEYIVDTPHLRLRRDAIELPGGVEIRDYYVRETRGFAVIFATTPDDRVVLVRQYKHGIDDIVLELPAGGIDPGESAVACAARELSEETGYVGTPEEPEFVASFVTDPTNSNGRFHLFHAHDARVRAEQHFDLTEAITVELATLDELRSYVRAGAIAVNSHVAAIYFMLDRLGKLGS